MQLFRRRRLRPRKTSSDATAPRMDRLQPASTASTNGRKLPIDRSDGLIQRVDLADKRTKCAAHAIGEHDLAILVETVGSHAL